jgi:hypothetical protein
MTQSTFFIIVADLQHENSKPLKVNLVYLLQLRQARRKIEIFAL